MGDIREHLLIRLSYASWQHENASQPEMLLKNLDFSAVQASSGAFIFVTRKISSCCLGSRNFTI